LNPQLHNKDNVKIGKMLFFSISFFLVQTYFSVLFIHYSGICTIVPVFQRAGSPVPSGPVSSILFVICSFKLMLKVLTLYAYTIKI
jgi:hypothetical protein